MFRITTNWIVKRLTFLNPEYGESIIEAMIETAMWENPGVNSKAIYLQVLKRILEEKGFKYRDNKPYNPCISVTDLETINVKVAIENKVDCNILLNEVFKCAKLTQEEIFIISLAYGLSTPDVLQGKYRKILDKMELLYFQRRLKKREIASLTKLTVPELNKLYRIAMRKLQTVK